MKRIKRKNIIGFIGILTLGFLLTYFLLLP